jgi:hypothetical protein
MPAPRKDGPEGERLQFEKEQGERERARERESRNVAGAIADSDRSIEVDWNDAKDASRGGRD